MGTTLLNEQPATYTLHAERFGTHCQHCFAQVRAVVPCPDCIWVAFCSSACRSAARDTYHKSVNSGVGVGGGGSGTHCMHQASYVLLTGLHVRHTLVVNSRRTF